MLPESMMTLYCACVFSYPEFLNLSKLGAWWSLFCFVYLLIQNQDHCCYWNRLWFTIFYALIFFSYISYLLFLEVVRDFLSLLMNPNLTTSHVYFVFELINWIVYLSNHFHFLKCLVYLRKNLLFSSCVSFLCDSFSTQNTALLTLLVTICVV